MKTLKLIKLTRLHWSLLGLVLLGTALSLASPTVRRFARHHAAALSAALLGQRHAAPEPTAAAAAPSNNTFTVRSYGGKCLEFGVPRTIIEQKMAKNYPVFISDCNGSAAQQVRVEELTDREGHLVILRAGNGVIGKKMDFVFTQQIASQAQSDNGTNDTDVTQQASPAALSATGAAAEIPVEVQPYTGSDGQIFALDGDSIILAADRNVVIEVQNNRGANGTSLVLGRRDLDDAEFWTFTATDGSARRPTNGFVRISQIDHSTDGELRARADFLQAVFDAKPGTVIELDANVSLNLTDTPPLKIPAGVTIRGDRRGTRLGALLRSAHTSDGSGFRIFEINNNGVRITGLRFQGPSNGSRAISQPYATAIAICFDCFNSTAPLPGAIRNVIVDRNEFWHWTGSAVGVEGSGNGTVPLTRDQAGLIFVTRNYIHENARDGAGYGVVVGDYGYTLIEGNLFDRNRHAVAANGGPYSGYVALYNYVLEGGYTQGGSICDFWNQHFDVHGTGEGGYGGPAGEYFEISSNTIRGEQGYCLTKTRPAFLLRGTPTIGAYFNNNVVVHNNLDAAVSLKSDKGDTGWGEDHAKFHFFASGNQFNTDLSLEVAAAGDLDGDGRDDIFLANGTGWWYSSAGRTEWRFLRPSSLRLWQLRFGDFDGDGRTDVFTQRGRNWEVSWAGISRLEKINESNEALADFTIGDFDGDRRADVFYADGHRWFISFGGVGMFTHVADAIHRVSDLRFGDFNNDGKTDAFGVVGDDWMAVYGGTHYWASLRPRLTSSVTGLWIADFNGDGRTDVANSNLSRVSWGGASRWSLLGPERSSVAAIGRFNSNVGEDVLLWHGNYLDISSGGAEASRRHSRQDMR